MELLKVVIKTEGLFNRDVNIPPNPKRSRLEIFKNWLKFPLK